MSERRSREPRGANGAGPKVPLEAGAKRRRLCERLGMSERLAATNGSRRTVERRSRET